MQTTTMQSLNLAGQNKPTETYHLQLSSSTTHASSLHSHGHLTGIKLNTQAS